MTSVFFRIANLNYHAALDAVVHDVKRLLLIDLASDAVGDVVLGLFTERDARLERMVARVFLTDRLVAQAALAGRYRNCVEFLDHSLVIVVLEGNRAVADHLAAHGNRRIEARASIVELVEDIGAPLARVDFHVFAVVFLVIAEVVLPNAMGLSELMVLGLAV